MKLNNKYKQYLKKLYEHKVAVIVIILLFLAKFLGFVKNMFMAKYYGTSVVSDAYQMAVSIPNIILGITLFSYQAFAKGYFLSAKEDRTNKYVNSFINFILIIEMILFFAIMLFGHDFIKILAPGFNTEQFMYTKKLMIPIVIGTLFLGIANIFAEYLRCKDVYVLPQIAFLTINIIEILAIFLAFYKNVNWLSYGFLIANFIYCIILMIIAIKKKFRYKLYFSFEDIKKIKNILLPVFFSSIVYDISVMVDKIFASNYDVGTVSILNYAANMQSVFLIIAAGFITVIYPKLAKNVADHEYDVFSNKISNSRKILIIIHVPIIIFLIFFSKDITKMVYYRGAFEIEALIGTSKAFILYSLGIIAIAIRDLYIKSLYFLNKGKTVILISLLSVLLNIIFNFILSKVMGYTGLALATSLSNWIILPILIYIYNKTIKKYKEQLI